MPLGSSCGREKRRTVLPNIQGVLSSARLPAPDNGLDVLHLAGWSLRDRLRLMEWRQVLTTQRAEEESRMAEVYRLEERVRGCRRFGSTSGGA